jgi:HSP20 family molecular chaperone IbpA
MLQGLGTLLDDPDLGRMLDDLGKSLQGGMGGLGQLFRGFLGPTPPHAPSPAPPSPAPDPFSGLLDQMLDLFGRSRARPPAPRAPASSPASPRIEAHVRDDGARYLVRCRFPRGAPETATFRIEGRTLVVKGKFAGGDEERRVDLPGPVDPQNARSELVGGELVVTLPKTL